MSASFHLTKSPLVEATFYVEGAAHVQSTKENLEQISSRFLPEFDNIKILPLNQIRGRVSAMIKDNGSGFAIVGSNATSSRGVLMKSNIFSYSVLGTYKSWESFVAEAWVEYEKYEKCFCPVKTLRVGVRSVNEFGEAPGNVDPSNVFRTESCKFTGQGLVPIRTDHTCSVFYSELNLFSVTRQSVKVRPRFDDSLCTKLSLDIDVFALEKDGIATEEIRKKFDMIHELKNRIFLDMVQEDYINNNLR